MTAPDPSIVFRLKPSSGIAPYRQLVEQVRNAVSTGRLKPGDQLPPVREVVTQITINPNTVHRAYRELEHLGIAEGKWGLGTFIKKGAFNEGDSDSSRSVEEQLGVVLNDARSSGLSNDAILELVKKNLRMSIEIDR